MRGSKLYPKLTRETYLWLAQKGGGASELLDVVGSDSVCDTWQFSDKTWEALFGCNFLRELRLSAHMTDFTGRKGLFSFDALEMLSSSVVTRDDLLTLIHRIKSLYHEFLSIRREFVQVWSLRAYEIGMDGCMSVFDKAGVQMGEAVKWLSTQIAQLHRGGIIDSSLDSYEAGKNYEILWTADFRNLWDRAYPWQ